MARSLVLRLSLLLGLIIHLGGSGRVLASCDVKYRNAILLLQNLSPQTAIATIQVDSSWLAKGCEVQGWVRVVEQHHGPRLPADFRLITGWLGGNNLPALLRAGCRYFVILSKDDHLQQPTYSSLGGCDNFSMHLGCDKADANDEFEEHYVKFVKDYLTKVSLHKSTKIRISTLEGHVYATGRLRRGIPVGAWHFQEGWEPGSKIEVLYDDRGRLVSKTKVLLGEEGYSRVVERTHIRGDTTYTEKYRERDLSLDYTLQEVLLDNGALHTVGKMVNPSDRSMKVASYLNYGHSIVWHGLTLMLSGEGDTLSRKEFFHGAAIGRWLWREGDQVMEKTYQGPDMPIQPQVLSFHESGEIAARIVQPSESQPKEVREFDVQGHLNSIKAFDSEDRITKYLTGIAPNSTYRREEHYLEGRRHGAFRTFNRGANDSLVMILSSEFREGTQVGIAQEYDLLGQLRVEEHFDSLGQRHGLHRRWYDNGMLAKEYTFRHDVPIGTAKIFRYDGTLAVLISYAEDGDSATVDTYDAGGKLVGSCQEKMPRLDESMGSPRCTQESVFLFCWDGI